MKSGSRICREDDLGRIYLWREECDMRCGAVYWKSRLEELVCFRDTTANWF